MILDAFIRMMDVPKQALFGSRSGKLRLGRVDTVSLRLGCAYAHDDKGGGDGMVHGHLEHARGARPYDGMRERARAGT